MSHIYGDSEAVPSLILELSKTNSKAVLDELVWENLYHQNSISQITLASIPHLIEIAKKSNSIDFKFEIIYDLGILLIDFNSYPLYIDQILDQKYIENDIKKRIKKAFDKAKKEFSSIVNSLLINVNILDEESKIYFLVACGRDNEAKIFKIFPTNEEYMFLCPNCEEETFLWYQNSMLSGYPKDPVFSKNQTKIEIEKIHKLNIKMKAYIFCRI